MISRTLTEIAANQSALPFLTCLGLVIFVAFFVGAIFWTARRGSNDLYQAMSQLPLESEAKK